MESDSANKISKSSVKDRRRKHLRFIISLIVFFVLIIAAIISVLVMIKRDYDTESPANNQDKAINSICSLTPYYDDCSRYMSSLYKNSNSSKINSTQIFNFALHTSINELKRFASLSKSQSTLNDCNYQLNNSLSQLNSYLVIAEKNLTVKAEMIRWLVTARAEIYMCLNSIEYERAGLSTSMADAYNSLAILAKMDIISEMFDPSINSVLGFGSFRQSGQSVVALFLSDKVFRVTVCIFGVQFVFLLLLICLLLRVW